jgi:hypothetical protein
MEKFWLRSRTPRAAPQVFGQVTETHQWTLATDPMPPKMRNPFPYLA